ncbi:MAG: hypothetical protein HQK89_08460 [Nitrospirae bacterium]|nr:hypothetical protein [Nitrospirota bacterium]
MAEILKYYNNGVLSAVEEFIDELKWDIAFNNSRDFPEKMAEEALGDLGAGRAEPMDLDDRL